MTKTQIKLITNTNAKRPSKILLGVKMVPRPLPSKFETHYCHLLDLYVRSNRMSGPEPYMVVG